MKRPVPGSYNPYFQGYFNLIPEGELMELLQQNTGEVVEFFLNIPEAKESYAYAPGKWNIKEVLNHINDAERIFAYRSLVAARMDSETDLMSFDENKYAANARVADRSLRDLIDEFKIIRAGSLYLMKHINEEEAVFKAKNGDHYFTAAAGLSFMIGHAIHHLNVLRDRYL